MPLTQIALDIIQKRLEEYAGRSQGRLENDLVKGTNGTNEICESSWTPVEPELILKEVENQPSSSQE